MKNYIELSDEVRKRLGLEKNVVYNLYTLPTLKYPVKFTDIGLVHAINDSFMDYPILLELMLGSMELKKVVTLEHKNVPINNRFSDFYSLFHMNNFVKSFKELLHKDNNCAQDVCNILDYEWAEEIIDAKCFNADILALFIYDSMNDRDFELTCMKDFYHYVLEYIFDNYISIDICETIVYNDCIDYINKFNIGIEEEKIGEIIEKYFDWSEPYEDSMDFICGYIEGGNK